MNFNQQTLEWDDLVLEMPKDASGLDNHAVSVAWKKADYQEITNFEEYVPKGLSKEEHNQFKALLEEYQDIFQGKLGCLTIDPIEVEIRADAEPFFCRPYPIPRSQLDSFKAEVDRLESIGVLKKIFDSPWGSPSFGVPKPNGSMRLVTDLREVNKRSVRKYFPLPKIDEIFQSVAGFDYATAVDFNMGFYNVRIGQKSQKIFTTVLPWGKYCYCRLPMGFISSPDIFQYVMQRLFGDIPGVIIYVDDLLILTKGSMLDHIKAL